MSNGNENLSAKAVEQRHVFRKCLPLKLKLDEVIRLLGDTRTVTGLDIGSPNVMMSYHLRRHGGRWKSVVADNTLMEAAHALIGEEIHELQGAKLPFPDRAFDVVVVFDLLERIPSADALVQECHRVLKPDGRLVLTAARQKPWSLLQRIRSKRGAVRPGFTEPMLFNVLKDGFDVIQMRSRFRFFLELTDTVVESVVSRLRAEAGGAASGLRRFYSLAAPFYVVANQLDMLLFFTRGFSVVALAKRRLWRPRKTGMMVDGRRISEAVLDQPR